MSNETSLRARFAALGVTPPFRELAGEVFDAASVSVALPFPDLYDNVDRDPPLARLIAEGLNRAIAEDEAA